MSSGYSCGNWPNTNNSNNNNTFPMALSGSRNVMRFAFVCQISEDKLQSNIRLSGGLQEHVRLMQTIATYQSRNRGRESSEPKEHSVYPH